MVQQPDQVIARKYQLVRRLARGGMGAVWLARHLELQSEVALKFLRTEQGSDEKAEERFRREARAAAQLKSPHVVQIHDFGIDSGAPYIAMELLCGEDLCSRLDRDGGLPVPVAFEILAQAAKGLRAAHQSGIVHRDIKPSNIFLSENAGEVLVKILDFGIAKAEVPDGLAMTTQGQVFGSPAYMSPEQARAGQVDLRSDLWSLGAVFYEMLTGKPPFSGTSPSDVVVKLCTEDVGSAFEIRPELGPNIDAFFRRALARDVAQRFASVDEMLSALQMERSSSIAPLQVAGSSQRAGRREETAPLSVPGEQAFTDPRERVSAHTSLPGAMPSLRPSLMPERPRPSEARGIFAVGGVLLLLGVAGLLMNKKPTARASHPPLSGGAEAYAPVSAGTRQEVVAKKLPVQPISPAPLRDASPRAVALPVSEPTAEPHRTRPHPVRAPSPPKKTAVEPTTDPVFGLPVDEP